MGDQPDSSREKGDMVEQEANENGTATEVAVAAKPKRVRTG